MEARVAVLESHMEYVRSDLAEIKAEQRATSAAIASLATATEKLAAKDGACELKLSAQMASRMAALPTKTDLKSFYLRSLAI